MPSCKRAVFVSVNFLINKVMKSSERLTISVCIGFQQQSDNISRKQLSVVWFQA